MSRQHDVDREDLDNVSDRAGRSMCRDARERLRYKLIEHRQ